MCRFCVRVSSLYGLHDFLKYVILVNSEHKVIKLILRAVH